MLTALLTPIVSRWFDIWGWSKLFGVFVQSIYLAGLSTSPCTITSSLRDQLARSEVACGGTREGACLALA